MNTNRRTFLTTAAALAVMPTAVQPQAAAQSRGKPTTFVLIHGGGRGGWCWKKVSDRLRAQGHEVFTPTMTGFGERSHLLKGQVDLETNITDIVNVLQWEDLRNVTLVGHSYGGVVITAVADRVADRIGRMVYLDALWPHDGETIADLLGPESAASVEAQAKAPPRPAAEQAESLSGGGQMSAADAAWMAPKITIHPPKTLRQPIRIKRADVGVPVLFVQCLPPFIRAVNISVDRAKARAAKGQKVRMVSIKAPHDVMVTHPKEAVDAITTGWDA